MGTWIGEYEKDSKEKLRRESSERKKTIIEYGGRVCQKLWGVLLKAVQWASDLAEREREREWVGKGYVVKMKGDDGD